MDLPNRIVAMLLETENAPKQFLHGLLQPPKPASISIVGRRWFQRTYGNTYHTASISVDGKLVHVTPKQYGYGDQYEETGMQWLEDNFIVPRRDSSENGSQTSPWRHMEELGIAYSRYAIDVKRERDL